jgi:RNA polymerase sigma factor (TIGR02999 family)
MAGFGQNWSTQFREKANSPILKTWRKQIASEPSLGYRVTMGDVTHLLSAIEAGDPQAAGKLLPLVYDELRRLAANRLSQEPPGQTLQATALVHEAYLRLVASPAGQLGMVQEFDGQGHFFAAAAEAMRRILIEQARRKRSLKRGGNFERQELVDIEAATESPHLDLLALDEALAKLEAKDSRKAQLVKLRFFAGLSNEQAALALGVAPSTASLDWAYAKSWLRAEMLNEP